MNTTGSDTTGEGTTGIGGGCVVPTGTGADGSGSGSTGDIPCMTDDDCGPCATCIGEVCVGTGELRITLTFTVDSDFDLHVVTPSGNEIFFANPAADGGYLDVDQCIEPCGTGTHVENVFFAQMPPCGDFTAYVVNFDGRSGGEFDIEVAGVANENFSGSLEPVAGISSMTFPFTAC